MDNFSDKSNNFENISFIENGNLITDDFEIVETFNKYFQSLTPHLDQTIYLASHQKMVMNF